VTLCRVHSRQEGAEVPAEAAPVFDPLVEALFQDLEQEEVRAEPVAEVDEAQGLV
jgi:hypothetical protein